MRTTVNLDDDIAAAVERLRREQGLGLSAAVNELVRRGLVAKRPARKLRLETGRLGLRVDVTNVAEALDWAEEGAGT
ncbi:MAG: ribbon-helix-helix protein, CopG family [Acidimicrobiales bacterium]